MRVSGSGVEVGPPPPVRLRRLISRASPGDPFQAPIPNNTWASSLNPAKGAKPLLICQLQAGRSEDLRHCPLGAVVGEPRSCTGVFCDSKSILHRPPGLRSCEFQEPRGATTNHD